MAGAWRARTWLWRGRRGGARRDMFSSMWLEGVEQKMAQAACDEAFEQALREAESEIDAADARMRAALGAVDVASRKFRDAVAAMGTRRQSRSGDGGPEQQGESTCTRGSVARVRDLSATAAAECASGRSMFHPI